MRVIYFNRLDPVSRVLAARSKTGLSQAQFAILLGVSVRTLQDWEQGRREQLYNNLTKATALTAITINVPNLKVMRCSS